MSSPRFVFVAAGSGLGWRGLGGLALACGLVWGAGPAAAQMGGMGPAGGPGGGGGFGDPGMNQGGGSGMNPGGNPGAGAQAGQRVELRFNLPVGLRAEFDESQELIIAGNASDGFGNQQPIRQSFRGQVRYEMQVLESPDGVPSRVQLRFDPGLTFDMEDGQNPPQREPLAFAGNQYTLTRQDAGQNRGGGQFGNPGGGFPQQPGGYGAADGGMMNSPLVRIEPAGGLDEQAQSYLQELMAFGWRDLLPGRTVAVGETWNPDGSHYVSGLGLDPGSSVQITAQLAGLGQAQGRSTADLNLRMQINGGFDGLPIQGLQQGRATVDVATGMVTAVQLAGTFPLQVQGPQGSLQGQTSWQINRRVTNLQGGQAAAAGRARQTHESTVREIQEDAPLSDEIEEVGGSGPSVNGQSAPPFAGTFRNDQLELTLIEGDPRRVEIRRGDLVTQGRLTGNRNVNMTVGEGGAMEIDVTFQGYFEHNGNEYDFSAQQPNAQTIHFTTGKTTHELRRVAEPAAEAPADPNPFE